MFQKFVMRLYSCRYGWLHSCKIIEFIDHCDIQIGYARFAVTAVSTFSAVGVKWGICKYGCIVFFFLGSVFVSCGSINLLFCIISAHNRTDSRSGQGIVDTLYWC